jgi:hypothetical protein
MRLFILAFRPFGIFHLPQVRRITCFGVVAQKQDARQLLLSANRPVEINED